MSDGVTFEQNTRQVSGPLHVPSDPVLARAPIVLEVDQKGVQPGVRCAHCHVRSQAPCGAVQDLADLDRAHAPLRRLPAGEPLFEQGDPSDRSYTILRGWVALTHLSREGQLSILRFVLPGEVLAFERQSSVCTFGAVAVGEVITCALSRSRQERLELEHEGFDARHRAVQSRMLEEAYETLASTMSHSALQRVSRLLFQLVCRSLRRRPSAGDQIDAPLSQIQIGLATGLTAVHVSRTLRQLRESGVAEFEARRLTIHDAAALGRLAGATHAAAAELSL
jgi:CRP-like cAMP-binding protein